MAKNSEPDAVIGSAKDALKQETAPVRQNGSQNSNTIAIAYILLIFLGTLGVHRFYLGRTKSALSMIGLLVGGLILMCTGWISSINSLNSFSTSGIWGGGALSSIGIALIFAEGLWCFVDLFLIPRMARTFP